MSETPLPTELVRVKTATGEETYVGRSLAETASDLTIVEEAEIENGSYETMKADALKTQIEIRNHRLPAGAPRLSASGNRADLIAVLAADDEAAREALRETPLTPDETPSQPPDSSGSTPTDSGTAPAGSGSATH